MFLTFAIWSNAVLSALHFSLARFLICNSLFNSVLCNVDMCNSISGFMQGIMLKLMRRKRGVGNSFFELVLKVTHFILTAC